MEIGTRLGNDMLDSNLNLVGIGATGETGLGNDMLDSNPIVKFFTRPI